MAAILPERCCPLIVTDAGYCNTWFREVEKLVWFWLGRVRREVGFREHGQFKWRSNKSFYPSANAKARYLGFGELGRKRPIDAYLHLYKAKPKRRKDQRSSKAGRHHNAQQNYRDSSKEPWLLATNIPTESMTSKKLVNLYAKRMQIEESFRDLKSPQYGLGPRHSKTRCLKRFDILLLIAMLADCYACRIAITTHWNHSSKASMATSLSGQYYPASPRLIADTTRPRSKKTAAGLPRFNH